jgi:hypothetical protein
VHLAWLLLVLLACDRGPAPPDGDPPLPRDCPRACQPDDLDCGSFPYERLPQRCFEICYLGECCELVNGAWHTQIFDCARPADAGVDALSDGASDA